MRSSVTQQEAALRSVADSHPHDMSSLPASLAAADVNASDSVGDSMPGAECRICNGGAEEGKLVRACRCRGSCEYVHVTCLERWLHCRPMPAERRNHLLTATNSSAPARDLPQCEVCKSPYTVRIHHRSRFDAQRCCSARSCETYFECASLLVTLVMLIATPSFLWHASSPTVSSRFHRPHSIHIVYDVVTPCAQTWRAWTS
jgi:hypothetical protein